jgi:hypothetical protein
MRIDTSDSDCRRRRGALPLRRVCAVLALRVGLDLARGSEDVRALRTLRTVRQGIRRRPRVDLTLWAMTVHLIEAMDLRLLPDEGAHDDEGGL